MRFPSFILIILGNLVLSCTSDDENPATTPTGGSEAGGSAANVSSGGTAAIGGSSSAGSSGGAVIGPGGGGSEESGGSPGAGGESASGGSLAMGGAGGDDPTNANRLVAIGDLHSDISSTRLAFQLAGATNENDDWIGRSLTIVQLGDVIGRSDDEREVLDFIFAIREKAEAGGGQVNILVGNHEIMGGRVDNQAVGANPFAAYMNMPNLALDDPRLQILPEEQRYRGAALMTGGPYAVRIADFPTVLQIGETVYVHGGVVPRWAEYGIENINHEVSEWLRGNIAETEVSLGVDNLDTVLWTRQFSSNVDEGDCALLDESLRILGAKRMVVAHTVQTTITPLCDGKIWAVDVGMSRAYGGPIEVLEIVNDTEVTVLRR